ncbi:Hypothetical predicted protein [Olea europaea subsp. europaea]|uniref:Transmembrane protein n=1 Tax=Olea europaea subsp. europaea TaxID=158383 RepID=A0A8S0UI75_OLEEU|nr:Hypothetical predicted protein [Olea europaea subsp. europaea]
MGIGKHYHVDDTITVESGDLLLWWCLLALVVATAALLWCLLLPVVTVVGDVVLRCWLCCCGGSVCVGFDGGGSGSIAMFAISCGRGSVGCGVVLCDVVAVIGYCGGAVVAMLW